MVALHHHSSRVLLVVAALSQLSRQVVGDESTALAPSSCPSALPTPAPTPLSAAGSASSSGDADDDEALSSTTIIFIPVAIVICALFGLLFYLFFQSSAPQVDVDEFKKTDVPVEGGAITVEAVEEEDWSRHSISEGAEATEKRPSSLEPVRAISDAQIVGVDDLIKEGVRSKELGILNMFCCKTDPFSPGAEEPPPV